jgi:hypothetical protein
MDATAFTDRRNRKEKACKKEESIYAFCWILTRYSILRFIVVAEYALSAL